MGIVVEALVSEAEVALAEEAAQLKHFVADKPTRKDMMEVAM